MTTKVKRRVHNIHPTTGKPLTNKQKLRKFLRGYKFLRGQASSRCLHSVEARRQTLFFKMATKARRQRAQAEMERKANEKLNKGLGIERRDQEAVMNKKQSFMDRLKFKARKIISKIW